jgi:DNA-binding NarL/FixJ family response regulator
MHKRIQVLVADPRGIIREGLRYLLESEHGIAVVALADDAHGLAEKARLCSPNVIVMDERLLEDLAALGPLPPVVALCDTPPSAPRRGVTFVDKSLLFERLIPVVREQVRAVPQPLLSGRRFPTDPVRNARL